MLSVIIIIFFALTAIYISEFSSIKSFSPEGFGQFGDYIGGILNPLVAICALVALVMTTRHQQNELNKAHQHQEAQFMQQQFFDWLALYRETLELQETKDYNQKACKGKNAFYNMLCTITSPKITCLVTRASDCQLAHLNDIFREKTYSSPEIFLIDVALIDRQHLASEFEMYLHHNPQFNLSTYSKVVFSFLNFLDKQANNGVENHFIDLFIGQLSKYELCFIALDVAISKNIPEDQIQLLKKYNVFKDLSESFPNISGLINNLVS